MSGSWIFVPAGVKEKEGEENEENVTSRGVKAHGMLSEPCRVWRVWASRSR